MIDIESISTLQRVDIESLNGFVCRSTPRGRFVDARAAMAREAELVTANEILRECLRQRTAVLQDVARVLGVPRDGNLMRTLPATLRERLGMPMPGRTSANQASQCRRMP